MNKILIYIIILTAIISGIGYIIHKAYMSGYNNATNECIANNQGIINKANQDAANATEEHIKYITKKEIQYKYIYRDINKYDNESCISRKDLVNIFNNKGE